LKERIHLSYLRYRAQAKDARRQEGDDVREDGSRPEHDGIRRSRGLGGALLDHLISVAIVKFSTDQRIMKRIERGVSAKIF
jgi:hypothetical protein